MIVTTARSSEENGIAEQKTKSVRQIIAILLEEQPTTNSSGDLAWSSILPFAQRALNIMTGSTGYSPAELRFGMHNRLDGIETPLVPQDMLPMQTEALEDARQNISKKIIA